MNRKGFTLIELLIVVVIIGILAMIAIPKFANTKEKAYIASMKSDLRNLVTAEEAYFADSLKYGTNVACSTPSTPGTVAFCTTTGNTLGSLTIGSSQGGQGQGQGQGQQGQGGGGGWTASITNVNTTKSCAIYMGPATPVLPATTSDPQGAPVCR
jgi:prepilin-type N-terminal cleavage/methylation domain-containing protein